MIGYILGFRIGVVGVFFLPGCGAKIIGWLVPDFSIQSSRYHTQKWRVKGRVLFWTRSSILQKNSSCTNLFDGCPCKCRRLLECRKGRDSLIGIATLYSLYLTPAWARFSMPFHTGPETHPASCTMGTGSFRGEGVGKVARSWCWPPTRSIAEVAKAFELSSLCLRKKATDEYLFHKNVGF